METFRPQLYCLEVGGAATVGESWIAFAWCNQSGRPDDPEQDLTPRSSLGSSGVGVVGDGDAGARGAPYVSA